MAGAAREAVWVGGEVLARFAVGHEACDDGLGVVVVESHGDLFRVHVAGGFLSDGTEMRLFPRAGLALTFALAEVAAQISEGPF